MRIFAVRWTGGVKRQWSGRQRRAIFIAFRRYQSINQSIIKTNLHTEVTSGLQKKNAKVTKTTETIKLKIKKLKSLAFKL